MRRLKHVKGMDELRKVLNQMTPEVAKKVVSKANRKGAQAIRDYARSLAPIDTGALRDGIVSGAGRSGQKFVTTQIVGISNAKWIGRSPRDLPPTEYSKMVEYGHEGKDGTQVPPDPFMRDTFDRTGDLVIQTVMDHLAQGIVEVGGQLGGGSI